MANLKNILFGTALAGGLVFSAPACSSMNKEEKESDKQKTEAETTPVSQDTTVSGHNVALFDSCRSDIKFALALCENYYPYIYWCGEAWTAGSGLTVLYNADGTCTKVNKNTKVPTIAESDVYEGRYLTYDILPDIEKCVTVSMDKNTLIAACVLRYCIGGTNFKKSSFVKQLNAGKTGAELARTLTGWRQQKGIPNRCYFFAALMAGKIDYSALLDLRAEGCYNLTWNDIFVYSKGRPVIDKDGFYEWDFSKIDANLKKAKQPRQIQLNLGDKKHAVVDCKLTKEIVPDYVWQDVQKHTNQEKSNTVNFTDVLNDSSYVAYKNGEYKKALKTGKAALKAAETDKQKRAATYNIGISYTAKGKYNKAVRNLKKSLAYEETNAAQKALQEAQHKRKERGKKRGKIALGSVIGVLGAAAIRKKYLMQRQKQR